MHDSLKILTSYLMNSTFSHAESFINTMSGYLKKEEDEQFLEFERHTAEMSPAEREQYAEFCNGDSYVVGELFPRFLSHSMFLSLYAYFEHEMVHLCRVFEHGRERTLRPVPKMSDVVAFWKDYGVSSPFETVEWLEIEEYRELRNLIAHDNAWRTEEAWAKSDEDLKKLKRCKQIAAYIERRELKGNTEVAFEGHALALTPEFCREVIQVARKFLTEFFDSVPWQAT